MQKTHSCCYSTCDGSTKTFDSSLWFFAVPHKPRGLSNIYADEASFITLIIERKVRQTSNVTKILLKSETYSPTLSDRTLLIFPYGEFGEDLV